MVFSKQLQYLKVWCFPEEDKEYLELSRSTQKPDYFVILPIFVNISLKASRAQKEKTLYTLVCKLLPYFVLKLADISTSRWKGLPAFTGIHCEDLM